MNRPGTMSRLLLLSVVTLAGLIPQSEAFAQALDGESHTQTEALRNRVLELEVQNAAILKQLSEIQRLLEQTVRQTPGIGGVELASTVPMPGSALSIATVPAVTPLPPQQQIQASVAQTEGNRSEISFYGFVRMDAIFDDSRASDFQTPTFVRPEHDDAEGRSNFTFHPRLTRIGLNFRVPDVLDSLAGARLTGRIETDFQNGGRESRAVLRYRHAFLRLNWGPHSLLGGQTSDLISPLIPSVNADTLMWDAGNLGDRRMQLRYSYDPTAGFSFRAALGLTGAVDGQDADGNGILDGEASTSPNFQGRVGYNSSRVLLGAWAHYAKLHTDVSYGGKNDFEGYSYGGDFEFRFTPQISLRGEIWAGSNLRDVRGGIGQSFNTATGKEIDSRGGWMELGLRSGPYGFSTGYTLDDPKNGHVPSEAATENRAWYVTNQFRLAPPLTLGIDYLYWWTHFKGLNKGTDNRLNVYAIYDF